MASQKFGALQFLQFVKNFFFVQSLNQLEVERKVFAKIYRRFHIKCDLGQKSNTLEPSGSFQSKHMLIFNSI